MAVHLYYAPAQMQLGSKTLAPQTVWATFSDKTFGGKKFTEVVVVGTDDTMHLVDTEEVKKALASSMPFSFGLEVLCPNGVKPVPPEEIEQFYVASQVKQVKEEPAAAPAKDARDTESPLSTQNTSYKELVDAVAEANAGPALERVVKLHNLWMSRGPEFRNVDKAYIVLLDVFRDAALDAIDDGANWRTTVEIQKRHVGARLAQAPTLDRIKKRRESWIAFYRAITEFCGTGKDKNLVAAPEVLQWLLDPDAEWFVYSSSYLVESAVDTVRSNGWGFMADQARAISKLANETLPLMRKQLAYAKENDKPVYAQVTYAENFLLQGICDYRLNPMFEAWNAERGPDDSSDELEKWFNSFVEGRADSGTRLVVNSLMEIIQAMCPAGTRIEVSPSGDVRIPFTPAQLKHYGSFYRYLVNVVLKRLDAPADAAEYETGNPTDSPFVLPYLQRTKTDDTFRIRLDLMGKLRREYTMSLQAMVDSAGKESLRKTRVLADFINKGMPILQPIRKEDWVNASLYKFLQEFLTPYLLREWETAKNDTSKTFTSFAVAEIADALSCLAHWRNDAESMQQWEQKEESQLYKSLNNFYSSKELMTWLRTGFSAEYERKAEISTYINDARKKVEAANALSNAGFLSAAQCKGINNAIDTLRTLSETARPEISDALYKWFEDGEQSMLLPVSLKTTASDIWGHIKLAVLAVRKDRQFDVLKEQCGLWFDMLMQLRPISTRDTAKWQLNAPEPTNTAIRELKYHLLSIARIQDKLDEILREAGAERAYSAIWEVHTNEAKSIRAGGLTTEVYEELTANVSALRSKLGKLPDTTAAEQDFIEGRQCALLSFDRNTTVDGYRQLHLHPWIVKNKDDLTQVMAFLDASLDTINEFRPLFTHVYEFLNSLEGDLSQLHKFVMKLASNNVALSREMNIALGLYDGMKDTPAPGTPDVNKPKDGKIAHRKINISGSSTYTPDVPDVPASGIEVPELFDMNSPLTRRLFDMARKQNEVWLLDSYITDDLSKNTRYLGLKKRLPFDNFLVVGGKDSSCLTISLAGKRVGLLTLDPQQITDLAGGFTTTSVLHVATHEIAHFIFKQLKNTEKMAWRKETAGKKLHPRQGADRYGFETEQFAILAETMVWGNSFRGLYTTNGLEVVENYFHNNFITEEDKKKRA